MTVEEFATLYDQHERAVYNFCLRLTGSADDAADATQETFVKVLERLPKLDERELNFGAYVMTVARHASYDLIARRRRMTPADDVPEFAAPAAEAPESHVLRGAHQAQIRAASLALPERQREVLALRELADLSYDQVAEVMGMNRNSVAQLISRARLNLRDGLRQTALGSVASASPLCDRALPLLALRQDGALADEGGWLAEHLAGCGTCRVRMEAMEEAGVAYRLWLPVAAAAWLRDAAVAHAAERAGSHSSLSHGRGARAAAGASVAALIVIVLGLLAADAHSPTRVFDAVVIPEAPAATPGPVVQRATWTSGTKVRPRRARLHRVDPPAPAVTPEPAPAAPAPTASEPDAPVVRPQPRRAPKAPSHEAAVAEPAVTPEPTPEPTVTPEPPPPPPADDPDPPPPPPPAGCAGCPGSVVTPPRKPRPAGPSGFTTPEIRPVP